MSQYVDRLGKALNDGDRVNSFNLMADGETDETIRQEGKRPVEAIFCILEDGTPWLKQETEWISKIDGRTLYSECGCDPADPKYGVEKI